MRILMLGNSFTAANNLPQQLASLTGAEVVAHTRGGARLAEQMNPKTKMGARTLAALVNERWDYVILQEMSNGPVTAREKFLQSARGLCEKIRAASAIPVFYATWAYENGSKKMAVMNMSYEEMYQAMYEAYHHAAEENQALIADVGKAFYEKADEIKLYAEDSCHPNEMGTKLAAEVIAEVILQDT
ncbi:MAG: SGNH/GDSL hydrolase family protein [Eubacteriales bacterium]|nr:SGNH/GDSL hydrolase family protein [Eubacteriales bacterium]